MTAYRAAVTALADAARTRHGVPTEPTGALDRTGLAAGTARHKD
ncbi:hypothetical protein ACFU8W_31430 [Streptomyces sp. NPDC057565]